MTCRAFPPCVGVVLCQQRAQVIEARRALEEARDLRARDENFAAGVGASMSFPSDTAARTTLRIA
jgi:hypothetical protein